MIQPGCGSGSAFIFSLGSGYGSALRNADPDPGEKKPKKSMEIIKKKLKMGAETKLSVLSYQLLRILFKVIFYNFYK